MIALAILLVILPAAVTAENLVKSYHDGRDSRGELDIDIWIDNDDGIYYEDEEITISFRANYDCYVALYSIDTRGYVSLLYPDSYSDNGHIRGGETYSIPGSYDNYDLIVSGPEGIEHIQAIASFEEMEIPGWYDGSPLKVGDGDDREDFIEYVNERYFNCRGPGCERAFDYTSIYVKKQDYYYKPVYYPNSWYDTPYYSMVYFDYPYGGEIYIDGFYFGIAPLWIPRVMYGWHYLTIYDHYGYCWEQNYYFEHNNTVYFDRGRVKTSRSTVSRYKDLRRQASKYSKSNYFLSDKPVKSVRGNSKDISRRTSSDSYRKSIKGSGARKGTDQWTGKRPGKKGYDGSAYNRGKSSSGKSAKPSGDYKRSGGRKSGKLSTSGSRGSSTRGQGDYKRSSGSSKSYKQSSGGKKSSGTVRKSGGSQKSSPAKSSGKVKNSGGSNKNSGGSVKRSSSGSSKSSSVGRSGSGKSSSGKSGSRGSRKKP